MWEGLSGAGRAFGARQHAAGPRGLCAAALTPACGSAPAVLLWRPGLRPNSAELSDPARNTPNVSHITTMHSRQGIDCT